MKIKRRISWIALITVCAALFFGIIACKGAGGGSITLSGNMSSVLSRSLNGEADGRDLDGADKIWAVPIGKGVDEDIFSSMVKADIEDDGTFSFTIPAEPGQKEDWILLLADTDEPERLDVVSGYVALGDMKDNLIKLPLNDASGDVNLGSLETDGQEVADQDQLAGQEAQFSLTIDQLKEMAKTDNLLKMVRTAYANYNSESGTYWAVKPTYMWNLMGKLQDVKNSKIDPSTYLNTKVVYNLDFEVNDSSIAQGVVDGNYNTYLMAPESVEIDHNSTYNTVSDYQDIRLAYDDNDPTTGNHIDTATDTYGEVYVDSESNSSKFSLPFVVGEPAQGVWVLKKDTDGDYGETVSNDPNLAVLDMANADPVVDDGQGSLYYQIYVPVPKINVDGSGNVTSVDVVWYFYNPDSSGYTEITDTTVLEDTLNEGIYISLNNAENGAPDTTLDITSTSWDVSSSGIAWTDVWKVAIDYKVMGNHFRFELGN